MTIQQHTLVTPYMVGPVHCYSVKTQGELVLIDTGAPTESSRQYLREHIDLTRLGHVLLTHCHIDHYGLASWLEQETGATIYVPYRDSLKIKRHGVRLDGMYRILGELGFDSFYLEELDRILISNKIFPPLPRSFRVVEEGLPENLGISYMECPGHSQSDLVYLGEDWAVTGDVLLRGIFQSPLLDVDQETGERFCNYRAYCETLIKLGAIRNRRILPGHRESIDGVDRAILFYITKMLERVGQLAPYAEDENIVRIIETIFGRNTLEPFHIYLKASEIVFMKDFLADPERLRQALTTLGLFDQVADIYRFVTSHNET